MDRSRPWGDGRTSSSQLRIRRGNFVHGLRRATQLGRLGLTLARARRRRHSSHEDASLRAVADAMGQLRGLPQKIGQILSLRELDDEAPVFSALTDGAPAVPSSESFRWIERELGSPIERVFRRLEKDGAAASLGQVHRGQLLDGREVAVKIQYPEVGRSLDVDLAALGWLAAPMSARRSGFSLDAYREELRRTLLQELDYESEVTALRRFAQRASSIPGLVTPVPVHSFCTPHLVTMTWVNGERFSATRAWPAADREVAALVLLRVFLRGCLDWREVHADPHPGNLRFDRGHSSVRVGLLDFGCVKRLSDAEHRGFWRLASDGAHMSDAELLATYLDLGFDADLLEPMAARLGAVTRLLFEPFHRSGPYDAREWCVASRLTEALGDDRWNFRFAGPSSLLFFIRALMGVVQYVSRLGAVLDWRAELLALEPLNAPSLDSLVGAARAGARPIIPSGGPESMAANTLKLSVTRDGQQVVRLSFAASAVERLGDLVPDEMRDGLRRRDINVETLARGAIEGGCQPGDLFSLDEGSTSVRVWLE